MTQVDLGARIEVDEEGTTQVVLSRLVDAGATSIKTSLRLGVVTFLVGRAILFHVLRRMRAKGELATA